MGFDLPREPVAWAGIALASLSLLVMAAAAAVLVLSAWRRIRLNPDYSPLAGGRAWWALFLSLPLLAAGLAVAWFGTALERYDPIRTGEPAGLVWVEDGRVVFQSAFDGEERTLDPWRRKPFTVLGDVLVFPSWTRWLGLEEAYHSARSTFPPRTMDRPPPPSDDPLYRLVSSSWCPGEARSWISPTMSGRRKLALYLLPEGGYATRRYP